MGFSLKRFISEMQELLASSKEDSEKVKDIEDLINAARIYAAQCGQLV